MKARFWNIAFGLAVLWMLVAIPVAAIFGTGWAFGVLTLIFLGPFFVAALGMILAFALGLIFYSDPGELIGRWLDL